MGVTILLTPIVIAAWPAITAAVTAAAAGMGLAIAESVKENLQDPQHEKQKEKVVSYEMELEGSKISSHNLATGKELVLTKDNVTLKVSRDERGRLKVHASGAGHSEIELKQIAEEFVNKVNQSFIYNRTVTELKNKNFQMVNQEVMADGSIRLHVRHWVD